LLDSLYKRYKTLKEMAEIWGTRELSSANKSVFNFKFENFQRMVKIFGQTGVYSPSFDLIGSDGRVHTAQLKITQFSHHGFPRVVISQIHEANISKPVDKFMVIQVDVVNVPDDLMLAGTLEMVLDQTTKLGSLGNAEQDEFERGKRRFINKSFLETRIVCVCCKSTYDVPNNVFCVPYNAVMEMKVDLSTPDSFSSVTSLVPNEHTVKEVGVNRLLCDIKSLLTSVDNYSDFSIVCQGENFPCHEAILRARSPVFDKMFLQKLKEWTSREMIMDDINKETVSHLLEYIYLGGISKKVENDAELIYVADKYHIAGLMEFCLHKLPEVDETKVVDILILADRHNLEDFKKMAMQRILKNKAKFLKDEDFVAKLKEAPHILMDFFQL